MAAFRELDWERFDVWAIVGSAGLATIEEERHMACRAWLIRNGYSIVTLDCMGPIDHVVAELHRMLRWEEQFGYTPDPEKRNLNALRDGFFFGACEGGQVLELVRLDLLWQQDPGWVRGLLSIAQEYSRRELALGHRFFALVVAAEHAEMIGDKIEATRVPSPFWNGNQAIHRFER